MEVFPRFDLNGQVALVTGPTNQHEMHWREMVSTFLS